MKESDLGWAAGFIDGEGAISSPKRPSKRTDMQRHIYVMVSAIDRRPLERLQYLFGGRIHGPYLHGKYRWRLSSRTAMTELITLLLPYLTVKREAAVAALNSYVKLDQLAS